MSSESSKPAPAETPQEWQEPLTGPGVTVRDGYDFQAPLRAIKRILHKDNS